jgi:catechol 2,3-dioxygenase
LWGQPAPASWFNEGSTFAGVAARKPLLQARPIVAM